MTLGSCWQYLCPPVRGCSAKSAPIMQPCVMGGGGGGGGGRGQKVMIDVGVVCKATRALPPQLAVQLIKSE